MKEQLLSDTGLRTTPRKAVQIETFISRLARTVEIITSDIAHEEQRSSVRDPHDPAYPMIARTLIARRDNLRASIVSLRAHANNSETHGVRY